MGTKIISWFFSIKNLCIAICVKDTIERYLLQKRIKTPLQNMAQTKNMKTASKKSMNKAKQENLMKIIYQNNH